MSGGRLRRVTTNVPLPGIVHSMSMSSIAAVLPIDRRQSPTALAVARGTTRLLHSLGFAVVSELPLASGRRADLVALASDGELWIVEIKSSIADLRADQNGSTTGFIATGCSSLPRLKCRAKSSRLTPALSLPTRSAHRSSAKRPSTASMRRPAKICCLLLRAPPRCACRPWPTRKGHLPRKVNQGGLISGCYSATTMCRSLTSPLSSRAT